MVDERFQGRGVGREAVRQVIAHVRAKGATKILEVSYVPGPGAESSISSETTRAARAARFEDPTLADGGRTRGGRCTAGALVCRNASPLATPNDSGVGAHPGIAPRSGGASRPTRDKCPPILIASRIPPTLVVIRMRGDPIMARTRLARVSPNGNVARKASTLSPPRAGSASPPRAPPPRIGEKRVRGLDIRRVGTAG
jgi:hypothetical protein